MESGSLRRKVKEGSPFGAQPLEGSLVEDFGSLSLTPEFGSQPSPSSSAEPSAALVQYAADTEQLLCALLHKPLPQEVRANMNSLMV